MADEKWASPSIPRKIYDRIDKYAKSSEGRERGFMTGKDVLVMLMREFLDEYAKNQESELSVNDTYDNRIILNDSKHGVVLVEIDENNKLQCYDCKEDPHKNKYVDYCLKNKDLWEFLKSKNVKLVTPRTNDNGN